MSFPLQTRALALRQEWLRLPPEELVTLVGKLTAVGGINTLLFPAFVEGEPIFRTQGKGYLSTRPCAARRSLQALKDFPGTILLQFDLFSAGPDGKRVSSLSRWHKRWLMRRENGDYRSLQFPEVPALFCVTSLGFRRFLGNLVADLAAAWRFDGITFDLRRLPRCTENPNTWLYFGLSSIDRLRNELGIDVEEFMAHPTLDLLTKIERWREDEFHKMVQNLKARLHTFRNDAQVSAIVKMEDPLDPNLPWRRAKEEGLIEQLIVSGETKAVIRDIHLIEAGLAQSRPFLLSVNKHHEVIQLTSQLEISSCSGFCVMDPPMDPTLLHDLPVAHMAWGEMGALESHPVAASRSLLAKAAEQFPKDTRAAEFFPRLLSFLDSCGPGLKYQDAQKIRKDVLQIIRRLEDDDCAGIPHKLTIQARLELVTRLLLMTPIEAFEY